MNPDVTQDDTSAARLMRKLALDEDIRSCRRCEGMNIPRLTASAPGYGSLSSPVALVGQSLCEKCMESQIPFTGGSGDMIDEGIERAGQRKSNIFISNAVHCHPPKNRASREYEIVNCAPHLHRELEIVRPLLVITLGRDAQRVLLFLYPRARIVNLPFVIPCRGSRNGLPHVFHAKHPSWIRRQHNKELEDEYISSLAAAIRWSFDCAGTTERD
ncbi:uracil-DNA glycosylase family protein [Mycobacterium sp. TY815]|uniref:uracil-DNA glycosylase family protein n=1 Tax=unclassified Mycobacterium TaxID=2642494 RepID=UPI0027420562|nr:uracil-DNA glycosylase family protein [Mycobacterium sp. TY815]MDP7707122.1 uracil-DNA glycosylase family protein [Mycobacterium sp. TY815]